MKPAPLLQATTGESRTNGRSSKTRTSDCHNCLLMQGLRRAKVASATINGICERMVLNHTRRRQVLYSEDEEANHLFALRSGKVKLVNVSTGGRESVLTILTSGDLFGFEAIFDERYTTSAEALGVCEVCVASRDDLDKLMAEAPSITVDLARYLYRQLCLSRESNLYLGASSATAKYAAYLLCNLPGEDYTDGVTAPRDLTLEELGGLLGLSPETVCRVRSELRAREIIDILPDGIRVLDVASLRQLAAV